MEPRPAISHQLAQHRSENQFANRVNVKLPAALGPTKPTLRGHHRNSLKTVSTKRLRDGYQSIHQLNRFATYDLASSIAKRKLAVVRSNAFRLTLSALAETSNHPTRLR